MAKKKSDTKKKSKGFGFRKDQPKSNDELDALMETTAEDWEILEMTERTLVAPDDEDEETIYLGTVDEDRKKEISGGARKVAAKKAASEGDDSDDEVFEIDIDDITKAAAAAAPKVAPDSGPESLSGGIPGSPDTAAAPPAHSGSAMKADAEEDLGEISQPEDEEADLDSAMAEPVAAPDADAGEVKKAGLKKSHMIIVFLLLPALGLLFGGGLFYFQNYMNAPGDTSGGSDRLSVAVATPEPPPVAPDPPAPQPTAPPPEAAPVPKKVAEPEPAAPQARFKAPAPVTPKPAAPQPATPPAVSSESTTYTLSDIRFQKVGGGFQMKILAGRPIKDYKTFPLSDPPRQVIDLFGDWKDSPISSKTVGAGGISRIRLGEHADKLRIVVDFSRNQTTSPVFVVSPDGLVMTVSGR